VTEVLAGTTPARYAETHAGSGAYPVVDDAERRYGILGFPGEPASALLSTTAFARVTSDFGHRQPPLYPGSALQAMIILGNQSAYLLCDLDPESTRDLRSWADRSGLEHCEVLERDGLAAVQAWLPGAASTVVHIDPFDPFAHDPGVPSAVDLAAEVAEAGHTLVYWYGYDTPAERAWAPAEIGTRTPATLWWGDLMVTAADGSVREDGHLGRPTSAGTGSGVVLANVSPELIDRCEQLAAELARTYAGRTLPTGEPGRLDLRTGSSRP